MLSNRSPFKAAALVERYEFNTLQALQHRVFELANDPADPGLGPVIVNSPDNGHHVCRIPQRRQPENAQVFRGLLKRQLVRHAQGRLNGG